MAPDDLFTRDEVLGGLPARRAASALFLIESRAAHRADQSRQSTDFLLSEDVAGRRDLLFLEAFSAGREPPVPPTIHDLERFAAEWARLVPDQPAVRAALARMVGRKYRFTRAAVPRLRAALGLDDAAVAQVYRRLYRDELDAIYAPRVAPREWLRAAWSAVSARVDALPPFWLAFLLTVAFSFSQAVLALPTAVAGLGVGPALGLVVGIGLINVLTMACMAEACARSGDFRYGRAYLGRLITGFLGAEASAFISAITALRTALALLASALGIGLTLVASTGVRAEIWIAVLIVVDLYYLSRKSQALTVATMLALLGVNLLLFVAIMTSALVHLDVEHLLAGGWLAAPTDAGPNPLRLAIGVVAGLCIGHVYLVQCAKLVLPRDPSARALIRGSVTGTAAMVALFAVWVLAVTGVVPAARLAREAGTALPSLAERIGPIVQILGSALVVTLLGMACLRTSTVVFNLLQERLPARLRAIVTLPRRRADLLFEPRGTTDRLAIGVHYLGSAGGRARLRIDLQHGGALERSEVEVATTWDAVALLSKCEARAARGDTLALEILEAEPEAVRLRVTTSMRVRAQGSWDDAGRYVSDVIALDSPLREMATWLVRRGEASVSEVAQSLGEGRAAAGMMLETLVARNLADRVGHGTDLRYRIRLLRRGRSVPAEVWSALDPAASTGPRRRRAAPSALRFAAWHALLGPGGQFAISASPVLLVLLLAETLVLTGSASYAGVVGFGGVITNSMTAAIFPVLLLLAGRHKGECVPSAVYRLLGTPAFAFTVYTLGAANLFFHGLVIYRGLWERACALIFGLAILGVTARLIRAGAFRRRTVVELRDDAREHGVGVVGIVSGGRPLAAEVTLGRPEGEEVRRADTVTIPALAKLTYIAVRVPAAAAPELKVWTHRVTASGTTEALPVLAEIRVGEDVRRFDLRLSGGQAVTRVGEEECWVRISLPGRDEASPVDPGAAPAPSAAARGSSRSR